MITAARARADRFAALAPDGAEVKVTDEHDRWSEIAQVVIRGSIDTIVVTIGSTPGKKRSRVTALWWFNSEIKIKPIKVGDVAYRIRHLYIDRREH